MNLGMNWKKSLLILSYYTVLWENRKCEKHLINFPLFFPPYIFTFPKFPFLISVLYFYLFQTFQ